MKESVVFKKNSDMVTRQIDKETILVPVFKTSDEINCIYTLNEAASAIWDMIDSKKAVKEIKKQVLKKFDTNPNDAQKKLEGILKDLEEIRAIKITGSRK